MKTRPTVVRGTPTNHVGPAGALIGGREGYSPGKPAGLEGTQPSGFTAEQSGYRPNPRGGTAYNSDLGNPDEASRVAEGTGRYGKVISEGGQDHKNFASNGDGVVLDKMSKDSADPAHQPTLDSPVPRHAPIFETDNIIAENIAHLGKGSGPTAPNDDMGRDDLMKIGGVLSR